MIRNNTLSTGRRKWNACFNLTDNIWSQICKLPFQITHNAKLQWLQYRITQHILTTNSFLYKAQIVNNPTCTFCKSEDETTVHLLWECSEVQDLLCSFNTLPDTLRIPFNFNKEIFQLGQLNYNKFYKTDNEVIILIKQYIYRTRCLSKTLNVIALIYVIKEYYNVQKCITHTKDESYKIRFQDGWEKWIKLMDYVEN